MDTMTRRIMLCGLVAAATGLTAGRRAYSATDSATTAATAVEQRPVSGFDAVAWSANGELFVEQTQRERLSVEAEPAVLAKIVTEVRQGRLWIGFAPGRVETRLPIRFRLEVKALRALDARGSGEIRIGALTTTELSLLLAGSDNLQLARLGARTLQARLDGSGELAIHGGAVDTQRVVLAGSGSYAALPLASRLAEVAIEGSGDIHVSASERLHATIAGSGDVTYRGRPQVVQSVSGAGSVRPASR